MSWGNLLGLSVSEQIFKFNLKKQVKKQYESRKNENKNSKEKALIMLEITQSQIDQRNDKIKNKITEF